MMEEREKHTAKEKKRERDKNNQVTYRSKNIFFLFIDG
jgi:hypothetical protein